MGIVPDTRTGKIEFYETHADIWRTNATQIGLTVAEATELAADAADARAAYNASLTARDAAKAATQTFYSATSDLAGFGAGLLAKIKSYAESTGNPNVYQLAQIPPPATPSPAPAPGTPTNFTVGLLQSGAVELRWKCENPAGVSGTIYECRRRIGSGGGGGAFAFIGATGTRSFTDDTLPSGSSGVTYEITAVRSTRRGAPAQFNVNFGVGGNGQAFARVVNVTPAPTAKLAA